MRNALITVTLLIVMMLSLACSTSPVEPTYVVEEHTYIVGDTTIVVPYVELDRTAATPMFPDFTYTELKDWLATKVVETAPFPPEHQCWVYSQSCTSNGVEVYCDGVRGLFDHFYSDAQIEGLIFGITLSHPEWYPAHIPTPCD